MNINNGPYMYLYIEYSQIFLIIKEYFNNKCVKIKKFKWIDELDQFIPSSYFAKITAEKTKNITLYNESLGHNYSSIIFNFKNKNNNNIMKNIYKSYYPNYWDLSFQNNNEDIKKNIRYHVNPAEISINYGIKNRHLSFEKRLFQKDYSFYHTNYKGYHNIGHPAVIKCRGNKLYKRFYKNGKDSMQVEALKNPEILLDPAFFEGDPDES